MIYSNSVSKYIHLCMHDKNNSFYKDYICFTYIGKLLLVQRNGTDAIIFNISYYPDTLKLKLQSNNLTNNDILMSVLKLQEITWLVQYIKTLNFNFETIKFYIWALIFIFKILESHLWIIRNVLKDKIKIQAVPKRHF